MSGNFLDEVIHPIHAEGRQFHYAATIKPLSIEGGWCHQCRKYHFVQIERELAKPHSFARKAQEVVHKARSVALLVLIGELLALAVLGIGASALAAVR